MPVLSHALRTTVGVPSHSMDRRHSHPSQPADFLCDLLRCGVSGSGMNQDIGAGSGRIGIVERVGEQRGHPLVSRYVTGRIPAISPGGNGTQGSIPASEPEDRCCRLVMFFAQGFTLDLVSLLKVLSGPG
mgnify:CR=1 FL=1